MFEETSDEAVENDEHDDSYQDQRELLKVHVVNLVGFYNYLKQCGWEKVREVDNTIIIRKM